VSSGVILLCVTQKYLTRWFPYQIQSRVYTTSPHVLLVVDRELLYVCTPSGVSPRVKRNKTRKTVNVGWRISLCHWLIVVFPRSLKDDFFYVVWIFVFSPPIPSLYSPLDRCGLSVVTHTSLRMFVTSTRSPFVGTVSQTGEQTFYRDRNRTVGSQSLHHVHMTRTTRNVTLYLESCLGEDRDPSDIVCKTRVFFFCRSDTVASWPLRMYSSFLSTKFSHPFFVHQTC
jgi:hypothetical protein